MKICAIIAASEQSQVPDKKFLKQILFHLYYDYGIRKIISGLRPGAEMETLSCFLSQKKNYPDLTVNGVFAHEEEAAQWPETAREKLYNLISRCDEELVLKPVFDNDKEFQRNIVMMNAADVVLFLGNDKNAEFWARKLSGSVLKVNIEKNILIPHLTLYRNYKKSNRSE